jgi:hypothetical protein
MSLMLGSSLSIFLQSEDNLPVTSETHFFLCFSIQ